MTRYIVDSFAWIEYFEATKRGIAAKNIIEDETNDIFTHVFSLAEIASRLSRSGIEPSSPIEKIMSLSEIIDINNEISVRAGRLHAEVRKEIKDFGLVDAFILLSAQENMFKILTGDPHFKGFKEAVII